MVPRAVEMAKAVTAAAVAASQGNILAPNYKSWQDNSYDYYTRGANQGFGTNFLYDVRSFTGTYTFIPPTTLIYTPTWGSKWGQPHVRVSTATGSFLCPQADSASAPPIDTL